MITVSQISNSILSRVTKKVASRTGERRNPKVAKTIEFSINFYIVYEALRVVIFGLFSFSKEKNRRKRP
jgi:hypothetical protein